LRLKNQKIKAAITDVKESRFLLEMLGFEEHSLPTTEQVIYGDGTTVYEPYLVLVL